MDDFSGIKDHLRYTKTAAELEALAVECWAEATETVTITSIGAEGTNSAGQINFPKALLLKAIYEVLREGVGERQLGDVITRNRFGSPV